MLALELILTDSTLMQVFSPFSGNFSVSSKRPLFHWRGEMGKRVKWVNKGYMPTSLKGSTDRFHQRFLRQINRPTKDGQILIHLWLRKGIAGSREKKRNADWPLFHCSIVPPSPMKQIFLVFPKPQFLTSLLTVSVLYCCCWPRNVQRFGHKTIRYAILLLHVLCLLELFSSFSFQWTWRSSCNNNNFNSFHELWKSSINLLGRDASWQGGSRFEPVTLALTDQGVHGWMAAFVGVWRDLNPSASAICHSTFTMHRQFLFQPSFTIVSSFFCYFGQTLFKSTWRWIFLLTSITILVHVSHNDINHYDQNDNHLHNDDSS